MTYKICLPTAGTGSRLNKITKHINKSLVDIENKPIISYLLENFPKDSRYVIPLGYKGNLVREYLELVYPSHNFEFVSIFPYEGKDSGLGFTLLNCKSFLQEPFIFIPCDALIGSKVPDPSINWMGYSELEDKGQYRTINIKDNKVVKINEKSSNTSVKDFIYTGLCGIQNFNLFWEVMERNKEFSSEIGEVFGMQYLIKDGVKAVKFKWNDIGNEKSLTKTREIYKKENSPTILEKEKEKIWFVDNQVIKFNLDKKFISNRVKRAATLSDFIPEILASSPNMFIYKKVEGDVFSKIVNLNLFKKFLNISEIFWQKIELNNQQKEEFKVACKIFYKNKTLARINQFFDDTNIKDSSLIINGVETPPLSYLLSKINWENLSQGKPVIFHGDFHFENIIYNTKQDKFYFLDWRQDFNGIIDYGDIYYDLAKLYHGLLINHSIIEEGLYEVHWYKNICHFDFHRKNILVYCEEFFKEWIELKGYSYKKVEILTSLIFLNISPLHHYPYSKLLFLLGKYMLHKNIFRNE